jgi:hypothetical protein
MTGDVLCGYYAIFSQLFPKLYGENTLGPGVINNEKVIIGAKNDVFFKRKSC